MKRTILFFSGILAVTAMILLFADAGISKNAGGTCCANIKVQDQNGTPVSGCIVNVTGGLQCLTGIAGTCQICGISEDIVFTVTSPCSDQAFQYTCATQPSLIILTTYY
ncbi:MAG: hypothetical protein HOP31_17090 [Ignavibacteria bacterium]|nr:hypothetical protein [Ignavibacteria bacterium]